MTFKTAAQAALGVAAFTAAAVDTVAKVAVGSIAKAYDDTQGDATFIYLPGAANVAAGDLVVYDLLPSGPTVTRLANNAQNNTGRPVAVALAAVPAGSYGWFQISGCAIVNAIAATAAGAGYASATAGSITSTADAGDQIAGLRISVGVGTPAAGQVYATLNHPHMQTQIT